MQRANLIRTALAALSLTVTPAQAQTSNFKLMPATSLFLTTSGSVYMPFKFYEVEGSEIPRLRRDPVMTIFFNAIGDYLKESGYESPCGGRDLYLLQGTAKQLKTMQTQWIATLKQAPNYYREVDRSLGDSARDADGAPIILDTYLLKGSDDDEHVRSFTFATYPTKGKTWVIMCRSWMY